MRDKIIIDKAKVINYLLNTNHPEGRSKALFFKYYGFYDENPLLFQKAMKNHFYLNFNTVINIETPYGTKIILQGPIETPKGKKVLIKSIWFKELHSKCIKLVTAYPSND